MSGKLMETLRQAEQAAVGRINNEGKVKHVCSLITPEFIAEEVYCPPEPPKFAVYKFKEDKIELVDSVKVDQGKGETPKQVYKPIFNAHLRKGMVILPRKPKECAIADVVDESVRFVSEGFDACGAENELKLITMVACSSWILDKEKPLLPVAGIGVYAPIIGIRGPSGSGKNRLANLLRFVSYHPFFDVSTHRIPSLYRPLDLWKGTLVMDEADIKSSGETSTLIHFLNSRATGTPIGRQNPDRPGKCDAFESFGLTILAQRRHFEDNATESRTIPFYADVTRKKLPTLETEEMVQKGMELQDKWLYIRMKYWNSLNIDKTLWVKGVEDHRLNSALLPIMALAKHAPKLEALIKETISPIEEKRRRLKSQSDDGVVVNVLWEKISEGLWDIHNRLFYVGESRETVKDEGGKEQEELSIIIPLTPSKLDEVLKLSSKRIRSIITSLNIAPENAPDQVKIGRHKYRPIFFDPAKLEKRLRDFVVGYEKNKLYEILELKVPEVPDVPDSSSGAQRKLNEYDELENESLAKAREEETGTSGTSGTSYGRRGGGNGV